MAKQAKALTVKGVENEKPGGARREIPDALLPGLYLVVQPSGAKSWAIRYRHGGQPKKLTLGPVAPQLDGPEPEPTLDAPMTLGGARRLARDQLQIVAAGRDPATEKKATKQARQSPQADRDLFENVCAEFLRRYLAPRAKPRYAAEVKRLLDREVLPTWGKRRINEITKREVLDLLDGITERGGGVTANRTLAAIRRLWNWAMERDIAVASPVTGVKAPVAEASRDRVLTDAELALVWRAATALEYPFGPLVKLLMLTAQRRDEVAGLRRSELSEDGAEWTLPGERTKNGLPHVVPLSPQAAAIIDAVPKVLVGKDEADVPKHGRIRDFVLSTNGRRPASGYSKAKLRLDKKMLELARADAKEAGLDPAEVTLTAWRLHDLRRSAASGMARLGIALHVVEKLLNHQSGTFAGIVQVYQRHTFADEKRTAVEAWANHIEGLTRATANVATFNKRNRARK